MRTRSYELLVSATFLQGYLILIKSFGSLQHPGRNLNIVDEVGFGHEELDGLRVIVPMVGIELDVVNKKCERHEYFGGKSEGGKSESLP